MAQPEKASVDQVLKLIEQLSPTEQGELRNKLESSWGERWDSLVARVEERSKALLQLTEEEIYAEFTQHRRKQRSNSAQSGD